MGLPVPARDRGHAQAPAGRPRAGALARSSQVIQIRPRPGTCCSGHRCALARMSAWTDSRVPVASETAMRRAAGDSMQARPAPTAESLMRSRYSAFAVRDAGYLLRTWHRSARPRNLGFDPALRWTRLAVLERATADSSTPPARCSSVRRTSSTASVASSRRRASSSGKTDTGPTSVPLTNGRLPHRAITLKSAMSDHLENRTGSPDLCACRSDCSRPRRCADVPVLALSATNHHFGVTVPAIAGRTSPGRAS